MGPSADDIFSHINDLFGFGDLFGGGRRRRRSSARRGEHLRYDLEITFEEAASGTKKTIEVPRSEKCDVCGGDGADPDSEIVTCSTCMGRGQVQTTQGFFSVAITCPTCRGEGKQIEKPCEKCEGKGRTLTKRKVAVRIPAGVDTGARLRLRHEGEAGRNGGPPGDLYVFLEVAPHETLTRDGSNLVANETISFVQAALGATLTIETLDGEETVEIEPGTQPGDTMVIEGAGVPDLGGSGHGDLIVNLEVEIPTKLSRRERELLNEFAEEAGVDVTNKKPGILDKLKRSARRARGK